MSLEQNSVEKIRADQALVNLGLASTRTLASRLINAGQVYFQIDESSDPIQISKPSYLLPQLSLLDYPKIFVESGPANRYVSRGGLKLESALQYFNFDVDGYRVLDVGISTGGFTDCVLQRGAREVVGLDVGHGQLAEKLRNDSRVQSYEGINARDLSSFVWLGKFSLIVIDVSFISLTRVLPEVVRFLKDSGSILALVKPQFELGAKALNKKGVVKDASGFEELRSKMHHAFETHNLEIKGQFDCPVKGTDGNQEFFIFSTANNFSVGL